MEDNKTAAVTQTVLVVPKHAVDAVMAVIDPYLVNVRRYDILCDQIYAALCSAMEE